MIETFTCESDCGHSDAEHKAFDMGRADALAEKPEKPPTDWPWELREDYRMGYSSGFLDLPVEAQQRLNDQ